MAFKKHLNSQSMWSFLLYRVLPASKAQLWLVRQILVDTQMAFGASNSDVFRRYRGFTSRQQCTLLLISSQTQLRAESSMCKLSALIASRLKGEICYAVLVDLVPRTLHLVGNLIQKTRMYLRNIRFVDFLKATRSEERRVGKEC